MNCAAAEDGMEERRVNGAGDELRKGRNPVCKTLRRGISKEGANARQVSWHAEFRGLKQAYNKQRAAPSARLKK
jgi:hypothetical protein